MKTIVITGTRKGIGKALAEHYLEAGWAVAGCSRGEASIGHPNYHHTALDVGEEAAVTAMAHAVNKRFGAGVDALLNNAGIASMNHALLTPAATLERVFRTNVNGTFLFCREFAKLMRGRGGRIVNFTSVAHPLDLEGEAVYASSKAAVESLTRILSRELADLKITVNAVGPTPIATDLIRGVPQAKMDALIARQAIRRLGEVRDVIHAVDFFLRPESDFITGQVLYLGGVS